MNSEATEVQEASPGYAFTAAKTAVPEGYKKTEVGIIPEEWVALPLKGRVSISHGFAFAGEHFANHGSFRLTTPGHFFEEGGFRNIGEKQKFYVGPVTKDYVLIYGDMIVAMTEQAEGLLGSAALIPDGEIYLHNQRLGRVTALSAEIELNYLFYVFNSPSFRAKVRETAAGTKVKHTSPEKLLEILVSLPPAPEQRAIATALSDADTLLEELDHLIAKKRDIKQATMQQLLTGRTRLPGFEGEWEVKRLEDIADVIDPHPSHRAPAAVANGIPFVGIGDLDELGNIIGSKLRLVSPTVLDEHVQRYDLADELIGLGRVASIGKVVSLKRHSDRYAISPTLGVIRGNKVKRAYLLFALKSRFVTEQFNKIMSGSTRSSVGMVVLRKLQVLIPDTTEEQTAIATFLTDMEVEIQNLEQRRAKIAALKQSMMQELLTGRTRLINSAD